jgi:LPS export ABC transporter protein LptC
MWLSKTQSQLIVAAAFIGFFAFSYALIRHNRPAGPAPAQPAAMATSEPAPAAARDVTPQPGLPQGLFKIEDFQRSESKDGQKLWEIKGSHAEFVPGSNQVSLKDAQLWVRRPNGDVVELFADQALITLEANSLSSADLTGHVKVIHNKETTLTTEHALYNKSTSLIVAPGPVLIENARMRISGQKLQAKLDTNEITLAQDVDTVIEGRGKKNA